MGAASEARVGVGDVVGLTRGAGVVVEVARGVGIAVGLTRGVGIAVGLTPGRGNVLNGLEVWVRAGDGSSGAGAWVVPGVPEQANSIMRQRDSRARRR